jgi:prevent-host-death family protein
MHSVGIKALKNKLSEYVRAAAAGETVLVTDRGQVVAELVSPRVRADAAPEQRLLGELLRQGLLVPAKTSPRAKLPRRKPVATIDEVLRDLDDSRADR